MEAKKISAFIHPDFTRKFVYDITRNRTENQNKLIDKWEDKFQEIINSPDTVMFYFSPITNENEALNHAKEYNEEGSEFVLEELERVRKYREVLDNRFIVFWGQEKPSHNEIEKVLETKNIKLDTDPILEVYGEVWEDCVDKWGKHLKKELDIKDENFHPLRELSLDDQMLREVGEMVKNV